jgi:hypothetical protein
MTPTIVKKVFEAALARDWIGSTLLPFSGQEIRKTT